MPDPALPTTAAILLAAGLSTRMQSAGDPARKPFLVLEGRTVLEHACEAFHLAASVRDIVIVGHVEDLTRIARLASASASMKKVRAVVAGGELRVDSVRAGVAAIAADIEIVAIHDVARPLVEPALVERAVALAFERSAALVAVPVTDTIKTSSDGEHSETTLDRSVLWAAQTPQVFRLPRFRALLERAAAEGFHPTDDAALYEKYVGGVPIVRGDSTNFKLTTPEDLLVAAAILRGRATQGARRG